MKTLVIAEKPSVGRDIARVLQCTRNSQGALEGEKYIVTWALGHLVTLADPEGYDAKYKSWRGEDLPMMPQHFKLVVIKQTHRQFQIVKNQLRSCDIFTRTAACQLAVMLMLSAEQDVHKVVKRLSQRLNHKYPTTQVRIYYHAQKIEQPSSTSAV